MRIWSAIKEMSWHAPDKSESMICHRKGSVSCAARSWREGILDFPLGGFEGFLIVAIRNGGILSSDQQRQEKGPARRRNLWARSTVIRPAVARRVEGNGSARGRFRGRLKAKEPSWPWHFCAVGLCCVSAQPSRAPLAAARPGRAPAFRPAGRLADPGPLSPMLPEISAEPAPNT